MGRLSALPTAAITDDSAVGGQIIQGSTIFDANHNVVLTRTPSSAGNRKTWTYSCWVKRSTISTYQGLLAVGTVDGSEDFFGFENSDRLYFRHNVGDDLKSAALFRDIGKWYHIVVVADTTQSQTSATASDSRLRFYVNGEQITDFVSGDADMPAQNFDFRINNNVLHYIGEYPRINSHLDGLMTEMHFIDGQALDSSYFGFTEFQTGIWRPKKYEGTYGTNGFYLPFDGSSHISKDMSGNGNDWTPNDMRCTVPLRMATGGLPILNTNSGGTTACPGVRPDPLASNIVLALPLSDRSATAIGVDVHHLIKGSGTPKTLTNSGSIANNKTKPHFYGRSGAINLADASSNRVEISTSNDFSMSTGDFTIECWIHPNSTSASDGSLFVTHDGSNYFALNYSPNTSRFNIYLNSGGPSWSPIAPEGLLEYAKWNHVALVKHSNVVKLYVNGLAIGSYSHSAAVGYTAASTTLCRIGGGGGGSVNSYMQDMRIYKGVAKYTDTFTCGSQDSTVIADSPSGVALSRKLDPPLSGSVGFEGTTSYLSIPHSTDLNLTNQDFCLEAFIYPVGSSNSQFGYVFNKGYSLQVSFRNNSNTCRMVAYFASSGSGSYDILNDFSSGTGSVPLHQWSHIALIRTSGTVKWFINGVEKASTSASGTVHSNTDAFTLGTYLPSASNYEFKGSISNARITIGEAVYTSNFTPSSEPLTLTSQGVTSSNVKLLCCKDKNDETAADKIPTGSITRTNSAYATSFSPFLDDVDSREICGYPVLNTLLHRKAGTVSEGNFLLSGNNYTQQKASVVFGPGNITTGKYYWEIDYNGNENYGMYSGITAAFDQGAGEIATQANKSYLGNTYYKLYNQTSGASMTNLEAGTVSIALDVDNRILRGYFNTKLIYTDTTIPNASTTQYAPMTLSTNDGASGTQWADAHYNFGQRPFTFTPPEDYQSLGSVNTETPSILNPKKHFDSIVYTPNSGGLTVTGLEFKPDFLWFKSRNQAYHNYAFDVVRGTGARSLRPSDTTPEPASGDATHVTTFLENGFYLNSSSGINDNGSGTDGVVAWAWKGGSPEVATNGSIFCEGSADHITVGGHSDLDFGTGNFTIEGFFNTDKQTNGTIICSRNYYTAGTNGNWLFRITNSGSLAFASYDGTGNGEYSEFSFTYSKYRWYHFAVVREGTGSNQLKIYIDGTSIGAMTVSKSLSAGTTDVGIGEDLSGPNGEFQGYLSNIRIIKGTALYTSNFTPPRSPLTNVTNTKLLCCQSTTSATAATVVPGSISAQGSVRTDLKNPFDAFMKDGIGYPTTSAAGITDGTVPLTGASINTKAGFSIVTYAGNNSGSTTFGHGLSQAPEIFFLKSRDNTEEWRVYYTIADGSYDFMYLNTEGAVNNSGYALPNATVINKADENNEHMVAYCWHSVPGYSKMGSYYGNGQTDGKFVYTGFKPAFVLLKRHTDGGNYWEIRDNKRNPHNPANERLFSNRNDVKSVGEAHDFLSNGFKIRDPNAGSNANDKLYIYMAFAEQPLITQYGIQSTAR